MIPTINPAQKNTIPKVPSNSKAKVRKRRIASTVSLPTEIEFFKFEENEGGR